MPWEKGLHPAGIQPRNATPYSLDNAGPARGWGVGWAELARGEFGPGGGTSTHLSTTLRQCLGEAPNRWAFSKIILQRLEGKWGSSNSSPSPSGYFRLVNSIYLSPFPKY